MLLLLSGLLVRSKYAAARPGNAVFLILSPFCFIANTMLFYFAFRNTSIANAVLTHYTAPVFVAILAPLLLKEPVHKTTWTAILLSSIGLWFILGWGSSGTEGHYGDNEHLGIIAGALSGLAYAFLILIMRKIASLYASLLITFVQNGIVALVLLPFAFSIEVPSDAVPYLIFMGVVHSTIAPLLYVQGFRSVRAGDAAILGYFEPLGAILLAFAVYHEVPGMIALLGGGLILLSGYMVVKARVK